MLKIQTTNNRYFWENSREGSSTREVLTLHIPAAPTIIFVYSLEWTFPMAISSTTGKLNIYSRLWKTIWSMHWKAFPWFSLLENSPKWSISEFWKLDHYSNSKTAGAVVDGLKKRKIWVLPCLPKFKLHFTYRQLKPNFTFFVTCLHLVCWEWCTFVSRHTLYY